MTTKYDLSNYRLYRGAKEATFNTPTDTTTNLATDTYYTFPMRLDQRRDRTRMTRRHYNAYIQGSYGLRS